MKKDKERDGGRRRNVQDKVKWASGGENDRKKSGLERVWG